VALQAAGQEGFGVAGGHPDGVGDLLDLALQAGHVRGDLGSRHSDLLVPQAGIGYASVVHSQEPTRIPGASPVAARGWVPDEPCA